MHTMTWSEKLQHEHRTIRRADQWHLLAVLMLSLDCLTTVYALENILGATEVNPLMAGVIGTFGIVGFIVLKLALGTLALGRLHRRAIRLRWDKRPRNWRGKRITDDVARNHARRTLIVLTVIMTVVVINNAIVIIQHT